MKEKETHKIKNLQQANYILLKMGLDIQVGMTRDKIFYVEFPTTEEYKKYRRIWDLYQREEE